MHLLPASIYLGLGVAWRRLGSGAGPLNRNFARALIVLALLLQGNNLARELIATDTLHFGFASALSLILWLAMLLYLIEGLFTPLDGLLALAAPLAAAGALLPAFFPPHPLSEPDTPAFRAHFVIAMLAYSLFTLAALHAAVMAITEKRLHHARLAGPRTGLPPLLTLEKLLFRLITVAFVLLTLTLGSGILFSEEVFGKPFAFSHKAVLGTASWALFGILLLGRRLRGWRGRTAQRWTLAGFVCLLLAYIGSRFVLEVLLHRPL